MFFPVGVLLRLKVQENRRVFNLNIQNSLLQVSSRDNKDPPILVAEMRLKLSTQAMLQDGIPPFRQNTPDDE